MHVQANITLYTTYLTNFSFSLCSGISEVWFLYTMPVPMATMKWWNCCSNTTPMSMQWTSGSSHPSMRLQPRANTTSASFCWQWVPAIRIFIIIILPDFW